MPYRLDLSRPLDGAATEVATSQLRDASQGLRRATDDTARAAAVHGARKATKKVRALLALLSGNSTERRALRDVARPLAGARDAEVALGTLAELTAGGGSGPFAGLHAVVVARRAATMVDEATSVAVADALDAAAGRVPSWASSCEGEGAEELASAFAAHYARARDAVDALQDEAEARHDLRKKVKAHAYHLRLVSSAWPAVLQARAGEAARLGDLLGLDHDLTVLESVAEAVAEDDVIDALGALVDQRRAELLHDATGLAARCLAEKPKHMERALRRWLDVAQRAPLRAGEFTIVVEGPATVTAGSAR